MNARNSLILKGGSAAGIHSLGHINDGDWDGEARNHLICNGGSAAGLKIWGSRC